MIGGDRVWQFRQARQLVKLSPMKYRMQHVRMGHDHVFILYERRPTTYAFPWTMVWKSEPWRYVE